MNITNPTVEGGLSIPSVENHQHTLRINLRDRMCAQVGNDAFRLWQVWLARKWGPSYAPTRMLLPPYVSYRFGFLSMAEVKPLWHPTVVPGDIILYFWWSGLVWRSRPPVWNVSLMMRYHSPGVLRGAVWVDKTAASYTRGSSGLSVRGSHSVWN